MSLGTPVHVAEFGDAAQKTLYGPTPLFGCAGGNIVLVTIGSYSNLVNVGTPSAVTDSGGGLRWVQLIATPATVANQPSLALWAAQPGAAFTGTISVSFEGQQQRGCAVSVDVISGVSAAEPVRLATRGLAAGTGTTVTSTLAPFAAATHYHFCAVAHQVDQVTTPGSGFTELADIHFPDVDTPATAFALEVAWKVNDTTADPSWATSAPYAMVACEIQELVTTAPLVQTPWQPVWLVEFAP